MSDEVSAITGSIAKIGEDAVTAIGACPDLAGLEDLRVLHLGRKSELNALLRGMKDLPPDRRSEVGKVANSVRDRLEEAIASRKAALEASELTARLVSEKIDVTLPGRPMPVGALHPLNSTLAAIGEIFTSMGFEVATGPDMEDDFHNFEGLNFPPEHPARDMQDTFHLRGGGVLRTHTSPVQIRTMRARKPPLAVIAPGKVYRCDADVTHSPMFHQVEGFLIDEGVRFSDLKGILREFLVRMMGEDVQYQFRPSFFPFTEPSAEVDILWKIPGREPAWLEVLGCGMIHPNVLRSGGYDPEQVSGFAFGMGVERFAMLRHAIPDIRLFFENDLRFLRQF